MTLRKVLGTAVLLIPAFVFVFDYHSARYGNGVFRHYAELAHGANLTYINGSMITLGRSRDYRAIIWPNAKLTTAEGDTISITKVTGYGISPIGLFVGVKSSPQTSLLFTDDDDVEQALPKTTMDHPPLEWIDLEHKPLLVYFWRLVVPLLLLVEAALLIWLTWSFARSQR